MLRTGKEIRTVFRVADRTYTKVRRVIATNPDRYGVYAVCGRLTDDQAFADAYKYLTILEHGLTAPPYRPEEVQKVMREYA
ncbi:MAG: hypothetical protein IIY21_20850 [Clostridiales bacterium]|nr:hypothetical protein [Clostridiales bacterium]